jgi:AcrR family transcriptional regulator
MELDRRVKYTREALKKSLIELMKTKPFQKITVKELCERADINRATFYTHYSDTAELLEQIETEFFEPIRLSLNREKVSANVRAVLIEVCRQVKVHAELCRVLFSPYGNKDFLEKILKYSYQKALESWMDAFPLTSTSQLEWAYAFFCTRQHQRHRKLGPGRDAGRA